MQEEMEKLRASSAREKKKNMATPPPKIPAPSPARTPGSSSVSSAPKAKAKSNPMPPAERPPPETEGAKLNRLRRLCEKKPSGKCNVPPAIHEKWAKSTKAEKEAMIEELEAVNWSKDGTT